MAYYMTNTALTFGAISLGWRAGSHLRGNDYNLDVGKSDIFGKTI